MIPKEFISIESLKNEDQNFCQHFSGLEKSEISSWNSESIKFKKSEKVKAKRIPKKRLDEKRGHDEQDLDVKSNFLKYSIAGEGNDRTKIREQGRINHCDRFKQLGFNYIKPEFDVNKVEQVDSIGKYRSMSLGNSNLDPDFDHFGCSVPVKKKVNERQKHKTNVYTDSYYGKFFLDAEPYKKSEKPKESAGKFLNSQARTVKLPSLRKRSSISDTLQTYQIGKSVFNFPKF